MIPKVCFCQFSGINSNWDFGTGFSDIYLYVSIICAVLVYDNAFE